MILCLTPFLFLLSQLKVEATNARIIGGGDSYVGQYPFAVAINTQTQTSKFFCGGALVNQYWVLTSAQCVFGGMLFLVQLGSNSLNVSDTSRVLVSTNSYAVHSGYRPNIINDDIGLIRLREPITYTSYIQPISLPEESLYDNDIVWALGWGQTSDEESGLSNILKVFVGTVIPNGECRLTYGSQITDTMVCVSGNYNEGTCIGDTGGPLIRCDTTHCWIVAIASFISGNGCESTDPSGFTRIFPYQDWINSMINLI